MAINTTGQAGFDTRFAGIGMSENGTLSVSAGSILLLQSEVGGGANSAFMQYGTNLGSTGIGLVSGAGSEIRLVGSAGADNPFVVVGRRGDGNLTIDNGGKLTISGDSDGLQPYGGVIVAREGGNGTLLVDNGTIDITGPASLFHSGRMGGTGLTTLRNGSSLMIESTGPGLFSNIDVGREGGDGTLLVEMSVVSLKATGGGAIFSIGQSPAGPGKGNVVLSNDSSLEIEGPQARLFIGDQAGASAVLEILSNSSVKLFSPGLPGNATMNIGTVAGVVKAEVLISGVGSFLDAGDWFSVGTNPWGPTPGATGNGLLTIDHGGELIAGDGAIGRGGVLAGGHGRVSIDADDNLDIVNGTLRLLPTLGAFEMQGNTVVGESSFIDFTFAADGSAGGHLFVNGDYFVFSEATTFRFLPIGGDFFAAGAYTFLSGRMGSFFNLQGATEPLDIPAFVAGIEIAGQSSAFGYAFYGGQIADRWSLVFEAVNDGAGIMPAVLDFAGDHASAIVATYDTLTGIGTGGRFGERGVLGFNLDGMSGGAGDDRLEAKGSGDFALLGLNGADTLIGGSGNDVLDAGGTRDGAANFLLGGAGNDTYIVRNATDVVGEAFFSPDFAGMPGDFDTIVSHAEFWWDFYHVGEKHVIAEENPHELSAMIGSLFGSEMIGNGKDNIIFTVGGDNVVRPGDGVDWIALGNIEGFRGTDTLVLEKPAGAAPSWAVVFGFAPGEDKVDVSGLDVDSFAAIQAFGFDDGAGNSFYLLDWGSNILFLVGLEKADLSAADFIV